MTENTTPEPNTQMADRRPLVSRNTKLARQLAHYLANTSISPNQISYCSLVFAGIACLTFMVSALYEAVPYALCMLIAVIACQFRLVCNLMDGMVAIEAGKQTPDGALWNEFPDRIADMVILVGLGVAAGSPLLGWVAATVAVLVAYVRELGKGIDGVVDFTGPMAKPHRMALVSAGAILSGISEILMGGSESGDISRQILLVVLYVLILGCVITLWRRVQAILDRVNH